ncbi:hypothetical protein G3N58_17565 [Paraburkholderia sp. Ac-20342]|uniref:Gp138 family membrane-puncturing spike protein n=1 Tax=Paraburkholderia sp. Ac-20342 TaxID=2703889 RepID=UPI00197FB0C6|nr:Gp138 family membrane-puncturing spike protein [Paraburkholderia sp. Ac-20342]MBN3848616.1 hypothetical protein [Paraburkholderia sp. Ac-20342]
MLQLERVNDSQEALRLALDGHQAQVWTALPAIIQSFNPGAMTCIAQPAIKAQVRAPDGSTQWVSLPLLLDCPVVFPRGGGCTLTFPVTQGDECLIVFASRCIDAWWSAGGVQVQSELRMHDLSDGFCLPGPFSQATKISNVSTTTAQLRSNDGSTYVELNPAGKVVNVVAPGGMTITAPTLTVTGVIAVENQQGATNASTFSGSITTTGNVTAGGIDLQHHTHTGVQSGSSNTGAPTG